MTKNPEEGEAAERSLDTPPPPPPPTADSPSSERPGQTTDHPSPPATSQESKSANDHTEPEHSPSPTPPIANGEDSNKDLEETSQQEERERQEEGEGKEVEETNEKEKEVQKEEDKEADPPKAEEERQEEQPEEVKGDTLEVENKEQEEEEDVETETTKEQEQQGEEKPSLEGGEELREEQDETTEEEEEKPEIEGEKEEKGDDSQISGTDVSSMDGKGDSTEVSPRRETSDLNHTASADLKTVENKNELTPDCPASEATANSGAAGDGADLPLPSSEDAPGTEEDSAPAPATANGPEDTGDDAAAPATEINSDTPAPHYEDDFSEVSEASDRGAVVTADANSADASADQAEPKNSKSPTPSANEEGRAERGAVVPIPASAQKKSDGRSFVEEGGERRGQDRSEAPCEEGVDSRGQGQWKSEDEELFLQSSLSNQQAEKEAMQAVIDDKVKIQREFDQLKGHYMQLEEKSRRWDEDTSTLKLACQEQNIRIRELEEEQTRLRHFEQWGKDNESKIKDLQDRLGALAGEDAEKDRRIQKLQEELQDTKSRLVTAERQVAVNNEATQQRSAQQSKTCTIL